MAYELTCSVCGTPFTSNWSHTKTCTKECRKQRDNFQSGRFAADYKNVPTGTIGAISEFLVIAHLLQKGYAVFHAASPSCFCDIVAIKDNKTLYFEIRTGYKNFDGVVTFPKRISQNQGRPDIYAVVERNTREISFFNVGGDNKPIELK